MLRLFALVLLLFAAAACAPAATEAPPLPTSAVLPTLPPDTPTTDAPAGTPESAAQDAEPTLTPTLTLSPTTTLSPTPSVVPSSTATPPPTRTPVVRPTLAPTLAAIASATAAPVFVTLTPAPDGANAGLRGADVIISERQFQEELNLQIAGNPAIQGALVDFTPQGMDIQITASGGQAMVSGNIIFEITLVQQEGGGERFIAAQIVDIQTNAPEPPEGFVNTINTELFPALVATFDTILSGRVGADNNLEDFVITDTEMQIFLVVPGG